MPDENEADGLSATRGLAEAKQLMDLGREAEALACYRRILTLDPENFPAHVAIGHYAISKENFPEARDHFAIAIQLQPSNVEVLALLGNVAVVLGRTDEAEEVFAQGLVHDSENVHLMLGMATVHRSRGQFAQALAWYRQACGLYPKDPQVLSNLAAACLEACEPDELVACCPESARLDPEALSHVVSALNYQSMLGRELVAQAHREWGRRCLQSVPQRKKPVDHKFSREKRLRLGFVSADFCQHPVGRFAAVLFSHFNRQQFDLIVYDNGSRDDPLKRRLQSVAPHWRSIAGAADDAAADWVRQDRIDILLDLSGHTMGHRLGIFARQAAPIQLTLFAYPNTTGLETVQYRITDAHADPPGLTELLYCERLIRLPNTAWVYVAPTDAPDPGPSPVLASEPCVFGCLNNPMKISRACIQLWGAVLERLPEARLKVLVQNDEQGSRMKARFVEAGAAAEQLWLVPGADLPTYFANHQGVDLMVDPFPFNGGVSTCDALWMGVPVLTLAGDSSVSRQGVSIMTNVNLPQCVAATPEEFIEKAVAIARTPALLAELRRDLRRKLGASPLMNYPAYVQELSHAFRAVWRQFAVAGL